jgi:hypothetical protein
VTAIGSPVVSARSDPQLQLAAAVNRPDAAMADGPEVDERYGRGSGFQELPICAFLRSLAFFALFFP